jgi:hypothetical protein
MIDRQQVHGVKEESPAHRNPALGGVHPGHHRQCIPRPQFGQEVGGRGGANEAFPELVRLRDDSPRGTVNPLVVSGTGSLKPVGAAGQLPLEEGGRNVRLDPPLLQDLPHTIEPRNEVAQEPVGILPGKAAVGFHGDRLRREEAAPDPHGVIESRQVLNRPGEGFLG